MANAFYNQAKADLLNGDLDLAADDVRVLLLDAAGAYSFDADDQFVADLTPGSNEFSDTNYVRKALTGEAVSQDDANDRAEFSADDVTWTALGGTDEVGAIVIYKHVTNDADSRLIAFIDTTVPPLPHQTTGDDFGVAWDAQGIFQLS